MLVRNVPNKNGRREWMNMRTISADFTIGAEVEDIVAAKVL